MRTSVPLYFGPPERALFGWYHPAEAARRRCGVVVCNPVGDDYVRAHRTLRHLAERLAGAGFAVLRFDFHGTGDSAGDERDPERVRAWLEDLGLAIAELKARSGAEQISLAGLRLGATLAMVAAAARGGVDSLVLWGPYQSGGAYVTESTRLHKMHKLLEPRSFAAEPPGYDAGGEEALGFLLTRPTIAELEKIDLLACAARPAPRALVIGTGNVPGESALLDRLRALGTDASYRHLPGHRFLITIPHSAVVPFELLEAMVGWLREAHPELAAAGSPPPPRPPALTQFGEAPFFCGPDRSLFGILSRPPEGKASPRRPAVLMLNAGTVHRIGPHRLYVALARRLAGLGFNVLRLDFTGIGDSPAAAGSEENLPYPSGAVAQVQAAMSALTTELAAERFLLLGLCSGADLAFRTGLQDPRVAGAVMLNPRTFCVHDLEMVDGYKRARLYEEALLKQELFSKTKWLRALRGDVDIPRALQRLVPKIKTVVQRRLAALLAPGQSAEATVQNDVPAALRLMAERGVDTFLVASERDPGVDYVDQHFADDMRALGSLRGFRRADFKGTDHTFTSRFAQEQVASTILEHVAHHL